LANLSARQPKCLIGNVCGFQPQALLAITFAGFFCFFFFFESKCKNKQQIWGCDVGFYHSKRGTATTGIQIERVRDNENG